MAETSNGDVEVAPTKPQLPAISAAFLVTFDVRKGYTLAWHRSDGNVKLDGAVEFKALPSGLHNVDQDLV